jgi:multidrug resistance efflux pump
VDIIRDTRPQRKKKRAVVTTVVVVALALITWGVQSLPSAVPSVDRATTWTDTVQRGTMVRMVRGPGTLVPEQARWLTAVTTGRIDEIVLLPGVEVQPGDIILRMSNPDEEVQLLQTQQQLSQAQAQLTQLRSTLQTQRLTLQGTVAQVRTQFLDAQRTHQANQRLFDANPDNVAKAELDRSREQMAEMETRFGLAEESLRVFDESVDDQLDAQLDQVRRLQELVDFRRERIASMTVRSPSAGILAPLDVPLQEGQYVTSGSNLGRVVVPDRLKAEIRIAQTQAQEIVLGQVALIDTRSDTIEGRVSRIDPAVRNGTVTIDVALPDNLPASARPDLSVDGNVVINRLDDVVFMGRPQFGQANNKVSVFKLTADEQYADRVIVELGVASVNEIEIRSGLQPGDIVILSEMSQWDGFDRVKLR